MIDSSRTAGTGSRRGSLLRGTYGLFLDRWDEVRQSYWFVPGLMTAGAAGAALGLVEFERGLGAEWGQAVPWLTDVSAPAARAVLSAVSGSMMTVTGVVFSITVVALTLTSSQFGPRLLRSFFRDRGSQLSLGAFLATFVFNLLVLRAVEDTERVPMLSTAVAVSLAVLSLFVLIYFVHHAATSIQASSVIASVAREIDAQLPVLFPENLVAGRPESEAALADEDRARLAAVDEQGEPLRLEREGYLRVLDEEPLLGVAQQRDLLVRVAVRPGDFVARG